MKTNKLVIYRLSRISHFAHKNFDYTARCQKKAVSGDIELCSCYNQLPCNNYATEHTFC